ncbi:CRISPR-associated protein Cas5 [Streptomyces clavuligerus]|nr:CRISPR-associated protein Cas5 [Streptomyces clavuligerus]AXU14786.1 CRISPR-associated protein Cas5 [Streptomyces clavuligerus]EDY50239.1 crispr-associated protein cas5 [Streptomyces clavuligerus]MBY6304815.1 CRISPR-associated protein Cas5 [Streptomyces clavuligerus]QCS07556.1 CRISPR-associated protein Cas5 [Streptomyces clavuligerus]
MTGGPRPGARPPTGVPVTEPLSAWRVVFYAPVASFRDPLFPGLTRGLPVPPPSTVRGLLAAATGEPSESLAFGMAAWSEGGGTDDETYHPISASGLNPSVAGRVRPGKGGMTIRSRPFLTGVHLTVWLPGPDGARIADALRRPRWPLRLGRSQDLVHVGERTRVTLNPAEEAAVGSALAPLSGHDVPSATVHRLAASVSTDRMASRWTDYLWCDIPAGRHPVRGAYEDATCRAHPGAEKGQALWLLEP